MHEKKLNSRWKAQDGISLLEVLLVLGTISVIVTFGIKLSNDWLNALKENRAAQHLALIHGAAKDYVEANFETLAAFVPAGTAVELSIEDPGNGDPFIKDGSTFLSADFNSDNIYKQTYSVAVRNMGSIAGDSTLDVVTFAQGRRLDDTTLRNVAEKAGADAGFISAVTVNATCCNGRIYSVFGQWSLPLADYSGVITEAPTVADGGFLAAYSRIRFSDTYKSKVLYRVEVSGQPQLNRMATNLNMNGYKLDNIKGISVDNINIPNGDFIVQGQTVSGASQSAAMTIDQMLYAGSRIANESDDGEGDLYVLGDDDQTVPQLDHTTETDESFDLIVDNLMMGDPDTGAITNAVATRRFNAGTMRISGDADPASNDVIYTGTAQIGVLESYDLSRDAVANSRTSANTSSNLEIESAVATLVRIRDVNSISKVQVPAFAASAGAGVSNDGSFDSIITRSADVGVLSDTTVNKVNTLTITGGGNISGSTIASVSNPDQPVASSTYTPIPNLTVTDMEINNCDNATAGCQDVVVP